MRTEDGARAWQILRRLPAYRYAWRRRRPRPGLPERAPFPVRLQTAADLAAARFGLLAWEDPLRGGRADLAVLGSGADDAGGGRAAGDAARR